MIKEPFPVLFCRQVRSNSGGPRAPPPAKPFDGGRPRPQTHHLQYFFFSKKTFDVSKSIGPLSSKIHITPLLADISLDFKDRT